MSKIQLLFPSCIEADAAPIKKQLEGRGYHVTSNPNDFDENSLCIALFVKDMDAKDYLASNPIIKAQLEYASYKHFRLLPMFVYDGSKDDPEILFEGPTGEFVEEIFSGEFKPYGWDVSQENNIEELIKIIEDNYAE